MISSLTFLHTCCFLCVFILSIFPALDSSPRFLVMPRAVSISRSCVCRCQSSSALSCFAMHCMFSLNERTGWYPTLDWTSARLTTSVHCSTRPKALYDYSYHFLPLPPTRCLLFVGNRLVTNAHSRVLGHLLVSNLYCCCCSRRCVGCFVHRAQHKP